MKVDIGDIKFEVKIGEPNVDPNGVKMEEELDFQSIEIDGQPFEFYELPSEKKEEVRELINFYR